MNIFRRIMLWWRLRRVDVRAMTVKQRFPMGHRITKDGVRYIYCKGKEAKRGSQ